MIIIIYILHIQNIIGINFIIVSRYLYCFVLISTYQKISYNCIYFYLLLISLLLIKSCFNIVFYYINHLILSCKKQFVLKLC